MIPDVEPIVMSYALAAARTMACFMVAPGFSSPRVPARARLFLALALGLAIEPIAHDRLAADASGALARQAFALMRESAIGATLGMVARVYLLAFDMLTTAISTFIGMTAAFAPSPEAGEPQPILTGALGLAATMLVFASGLDREMIRALVGSYDAFPPDMSLAQASFSAFVTALKEATLIGLRIAGPLLALSLVANVAFGAASRFVPQAPIYFVSAPILIGLGLLALVFIERPAFGLLMDGLAGQLTRW